MWGWLYKAVCIVYGHRAQIEELADGLIRCIRCGAVLGRTPAATPPAAPPAPPTGMGA